LWLSISKRGPGESLSTSQIRQSYHGSMSGQRCGEMRKFNLFSLYSPFHGGTILGRNTLGMEQKKQRPCPKVKVVAWGPADSTVVWKVGVASAHPRHLSGYFALHPLILNFHHILKPITHPHRHTNSKRVRTHTPCCCYCC